MFERFTDRARKAVALANQEAQRYNNEFVQVEHLLLGLLKADGVACAALGNLHVNVSALCLEVRKTIKHGDKLTIGRLPQSPMLKVCFEKARDESGKLGHNYVGTEHLLLALVQNGVILKFFQEGGIDVPALVAEIKRLTTPGEETARTFQQRIFAAKQALSASSFQRPKNANVLISEAQSLVRELLNRIVNQIDATQIAKFGETLLFLDTLAKKYK